MFDQIHLVQKQHFSFETKNMFLVTLRPSGNEGQCFLYEGCKLIAFHMSL